MEQTKNIIMAVVLQQPKLNEYRLSAHELQENLNNVIKTKCLKPFINQTLDEQSTQSSTADNSVYTVPEFNNELIDVLTSQEQRIYNKQFTQETYLDQPLFYINCIYNINTVKLYAHGHKPKKYMSIDNLGNIYLCSKKRFYLIGVRSM